MYLMSFRLISDFPLPSPPSPAQTLFFPSVSATTIYPVGPAYDWGLFFIPFFRLLHPLAAHELPSLVGSASYVTAPRLLSLPSVWQRAWLLSGAVKPFIPVLTCSHPQLPSSRPPKPCSSPTPVFLCSWASHFRAAAQPHSSVCLETWGAFRQLA